MSPQELGSGDTRAKPIKLGGALFTLVEPHRGHEVEYNRWYERDHFYAGCMIGAWTLAGTRYVATRDCKELRLPADSPVTDGDPMNGSYLALYWILKGKFGDWMEWGTQQVHWLHDHDRMFPHRDHVHTVMYRWRRDRYSTDDPVPSELSLDRRFPGLVTIVGEVGAGSSLDAVDAWLDDHFAETSVPADVVVEFTPVPMMADAPSDVPREMGTDRFLLCCFVDEDPTEAWPRFAELVAELDASGHAGVVFASPFRATVPGTDAYTDELW